MACSDVIWNWLSLPYSIYNNALGKEKYDYATLSSIHYPLLYATELFQKYIYIYIFKVGDKLKPSIMLNCILLMT